MFSSLVNLTGMVHGGQQGVSGATIQLYAAGPQSGSWGIGIDSSAHVWISNTTSNSVTELNSGGTLVSNYTVGGLSTPQGLTVDGLGNVWVANFGTNTSVTELNNSGAALSPAKGFTRGGMAGPFNLALTSP